jgi:hypothetical protein
MMVYKFQFGAKSNLQILIFLWINMFLKIINLLSYTKIRIHLKGLISTLSPQGPILEFYQALLKRS